MGNLLIATQAAIRAASITASVAAPTMPSANLAQRSPARVCRLLSPAAAWVVVEWPADVAVDVVAPLYVGCSRTATLRIAVSDAAGAMLYDSGVVPVSTATPLEHRLGAVHAPHVLPSRVIGRRVRIDIADPASTLGYIDIGALVAGPAYQPANGYPLGWHVGLVDPSRRPKAEDGEVKPINRGPYLGGRFAIDWLSEDEALGPVFDIQQQCGVTRPALVIRDTDASGDPLERQTIYGLFGDLTPLTNDQVQLYSTVFEIEELTP